MIQRIVMSLNFYIFQDPNKPKRAMSAFFLFSQGNRPRIKEENPDATFGSVVSVWLDEEVHLTSLLCCLHCSVCLLRSVCRGRDGGTLHHSVVVRCYHLAPLHVCAHVGARGRSPRRHHHGRRERERHLSTRQSAVCFACVDCGTISTSSRILSQSRLYS